MWILISVVYLNSTSIQEYEIHSFNTKRSCFEEMKQFNKDAFRNEIFVCKRKEK